jgi:hypothetical protein
MESLMSCRLREPMSLRGPKLLYSMWRLQLNPFSPRSILSSPQYWVHLFQRPGRMEA